MLVYYIRSEAEEFLKKYNLNYSEYSPILERKNGIFIIFEKGDIIIFNKKYYIYYGYTPDPNVLPKNMNAFFKDGPFIRVRTYESCTKEMVLREYLRLEKENRETIIKDMEKLDSSVKQLLNSSNSKHLDKEISKKKWETDMRIQGIKMLGGCCSVCGSRYNLSFVHRNPADKKEAVSKMIKRHASKYDILDEMLKCDLYCENCRQEKFRRIKHEGYKSGKYKRYDYLQYNKK